MRILYIQPWNTSAYADARKLEGSLEGLVIPRAMFEIAYRLRATGADADILDCNLVSFGSSANPKQAVEKAIVRRLHNGYKAVFLSWPTVAQGNIIRHIAESVRKISSVPLVIGGGAVALVQRNAFKQIPGDVFYAGDGVEIPQLLSVIGSSQTVPGMCTKEGIVGGAKRELLDGYDAETLYTANGTFDFADYLRKYRKLGLEPVGLLEMMRGCPYSCTYCAIRGELVGVRYRKPHTVAGEAEFLLRHGVVNNYIIDPTLALNQKKTTVLLELLADIKARHSKFGWWGITRCDRVTKEIAPRLKAAGCHTLSIGVETMDQAVLDVVRKRTVSSTSENAIRVLGEHGITARLLLMHFPQSHDVATVRFLCEQRENGFPFILQSSMMRPLYSSAETEGRKEEVDFREWDQEVDARCIGLDTDTSVLGWLVTNIAFPSTSVSRTGGDAGLQKRLRKHDFRVWLLAAQVDPSGLVGLPQRIAIGFLRVGYTVTETAEKLSSLLGLEESDASIIVSGLITALGDGLIKKRVEPAEWLGIVASVQPERWYYYPRSTEPFPQIGFNIKTGEYLEDLDQLILNEVELQTKGGENIEEENCIGIGKSEAETGNRGKETSWRQFARGPSSTN